MRYKIFHNDQFMDYFFKRSLQGHTVRQAAVIECNDLEDVYRATNSIDRPWTENPEVISVQTSKPRSLSVGDLVHDVEHNRLYVVESGGYREVTKEEHSSLDFQLVL